MVISVAVCPIVLPLVLLHAPMPLIGVLTPFVVHVAVHSGEPVCVALAGVVHVVLLPFNATHFVTAWALVVVIAHSIAPMISVFDFIFKLLFVFLQEKPPKKLGGQEVEDNP